LGSIAYFEKKLKLGIFLKKALFVLLPSQVLIALNGFQFQVVVFVFANLFVSIAVIFLTWRYLLQGNLANKTSFLLSIKNWLNEQGKGVLMLVLLITLLFLGFASFNVQKFAAVDEALWTFGRIEKYWLALEKHEWERTFVSDKPGITVSLISGIGLNWVTPENYAPIKWSGRIFASTKNFEEMNFALRFPILVFASLFIPILYFFIERFSGKKSALYSIAFVGLSPVLIGMARIINPDSLLWLFTSSSIFSYFAYLRRKSKNFLLWTGIFLGLALLTKYVSNILFIYFLFIPFFEYIFNAKKYPSLKIYLKESVLNYISIILIALATFYFLCPATWVYPKILLKATIDSQAFQSTSLYFLAFFGILIIDIFLLKNFFLSLILNFLSRRKRTISIFIGLIFLFSILAVFFNVYTQMYLWNFEEILQSPKSIKKIGSLGTFFANFYALIFSIPLIALLGIASGLFSIFSKKYFATKRYFIFLISFILLYYSGSIITNVALITRYQIMAFPIVLVASGLGIKILLERIKLSVLSPVIITTLVIITTGIISLWIVSPFYLSYASVLLPRNYSLNLKDMGSGSYEAAQFLNQLPNAEKTVVWTDKSGLCNFFVGICYTGYNKRELRDINIEYVVISSGRESRTKKRSKSVPNDPLNFGQYYELEGNDIFWQLKINNRESQYVRIIKLR
jgi:hypothetical protein